MDYELAEKRDRGEMPESWYHTASTGEELESLIKLLQCGFVIGADSPYRFHFCRCEFGGFDFGAGEPDRHCNHYDTISEGVGNFRINGKPLIEAVAGCRFAFDDCPGSIIDEETPKSEIHD